MKTLKRLPSEVGRSPERGILLVFFFRKELSMLELIGWYLLIGVVFIPILRKMFLSVYESEMRITIKTDRDLTLEMFEHPRFPQYIRSPRFSSRCLLFWPVMFPYSLWELLKRRDDATP